MLTVCLWITGIILFCVEFFQPMHGVSYALGMAIVVAAFVTRMVYGTPGEAFMFVFVTAVIIYCTHVVSMFTHKRDWLKVARMEKNDERSRKYGELAGSVGVTNTPIDLTGNATIAGVNLVVYSDSPIERGAAVRISKITPDKIIVERVDDE